MKNIGKEKVMDSLIDAMDEKIATGTLHESEVSNLMIQVQQRTLPLRIESAKKRMLFGKMLDDFVLIIKDLGETTFERIKQSDKPETWVKDVFEEFIPQVAEATKKLNKASAE